MSDVKIIDGQTAEGANDDNQTTTQTTIPENDDVTLQIKEAIATATAEATEAFKGELAGLNRKNSELQEALKKKELEGKSDAEQAELLILEKAKIEQEIIELNRGRLIDKQLDSAGLPLDFAKRIIGEDEANITEDIKSVKEYIDKLAQDKADKIVKERLGGDPPKSGANPVNKKLTAEEIAKLPKEQRLKAYKDAGYR